MDSSEGATANLPVAPPRLNGCFTVASLKRTLRRTRPVTIAYYVFRNWQAGRKLQKGNYKVPASRRLSRKTEESVSYINGVIDGYLRNSGLTQDSLRGKRVLEVGPGENLGVGLKFLAAGAEQVVCLDRFEWMRNGDHERSVYKALRETLTNDEQRIYDSMVSREGDVDLRTEKLAYRSGTPIEDAAATLRPRHFDLIVSCAVMEHVFDTDRALTAMDKLLVPGGYSIHQIDLRDHGMFTEAGHHPLTFLTIPDRVYRAMSLNLGLPNRQRSAYYRDKLAKLGYDSRLFVTLTLGERDPSTPYKESFGPGIDVPSKDASEVVHAIRRHLQPRFRDTATSDLAMLGLFVVARKPASLN